MTIKFPEDFKSEPFREILGTTKWTFQKDNIQISVFSERRGIFGDKVPTFGMWDSCEAQPKSNMTKEEINEYLEKYNLS